MNAMFHIHDMPIWLLVTMAIKESKPKNDCMFYATSWPVRV